MRFYTSLHRHFRGIDLHARTIMSAFSKRALAYPLAGGRRKAPALGSRRPHQGQWRQKARETGPRQRGQRSGRSGCDQGRPGLRLHTGQ
jgi:hypothetical protein